MNSGSDSPMSRLEKVSGEFFRIRHRIMAYLLVLLDDGHVAEDILQEVWVALARALEKGEEIENLMAWSRGVARNLVMKHWRSKSNDRLVVNTELLDLVDEAFEGQLPQSEGGDRRQALRVCMASLNDNLKEMLRLKYEEGMGFEEMARHLGKTVGSLTMSLSRARKKLGECIERRLNASEAMA